MDARPARRTDHSPRLAWCAAPRSAGSCRGRGTRSDHLMALSLLFLLLLGVPAGADVRQISLPANDLVYSPLTGKVYASVPSGGGLVGNSVAAIDPATGLVGPVIWVGSEPNRLAVSDDGRFLYVGLDGAGAIRRVDLAAQRAELEFSLGNSRYDGPQYAADLQVPPGQPRSVAVSRTWDGIGVTGEGIAVYDDGVPRARTTPPGTWPAFLAFSASATRLYRSINSSGDNFGRLHVDDSGVTALDTASITPLGDIRFDHGLIYGAGGGVLDPESEQLVGTFALPFGFGSAAGPAIGQGQVFFLTQRIPSTPDSSWNLQAFDQNTYLPLWTLPIPSAAGHVGSLIAWGQEPGASGVAFWTDQGQVFLIRPDVAPCNPRAANLTLFQNAAPSPAPAGAAVDLTLYVENNGPDPASGVTLVDDLPAGATLLSVSSSQGHCTSEAGRVTCDIGILQKGARAQITLHLQPGAAGTLVNDAGVIADEPDPSPLDNAGVLRTLVLSASGGTPNPRQPARCPSARAGPFLTGRMTWSTAGSPASCTRVFPPRPDRLPIKLSPSIPPPARWGQRFPWAVSRITSHSRRMAVIST